MPPKDAIKLSGTKMDNPHGIKYSEKTEWGPFTIDDVQQAFKDFDLDKNGFIGPSEIRAILDHRNEDVSDEVVDEMIKMCDRDGDGQINIEEFAKMVFLCSGPPVDVQLGSDSGKVHEVVTMTTSNQRKKRIEKLKKYVSKIEIEKKDMSKIQANFRTISPDGAVTYKKFKKAFEEADSPVLQSIFDMFLSSMKQSKKTKKRNQVIDWRVMFISLANIIATDTSQRVKFAFTIFDVDGNERIDREELTQILKATHMAKRPEHVKKKVDAIMRQADDNDDGVLDYNEFNQIAHKFPNLIFPNYS